MRTSFHHQPEAQHPNFQLSTSWQADYPIFWKKVVRARALSNVDSIGRERGPDDRAGPWCRLFDDA